MPMFYTMSFLYSKIQASEFFFSRDKENVKDYGKKVVGFQISGIRNSSLKGLRITELRPRLK